MKCGCYIRWSKRNPNIREDYVTPYQIQVLGEPIPDGAIKCDGNIIVSITPRYCGEDRTDTFVYKCDTCDLIVFETFPEDLDYIANFLTKMVADLPESWRDELYFKKREEMEAIDNKRKKKNVSR